jgi:hypothetical protein
MDRKLAMGGRAASGANVLLGAWIMLSPLIYGFATRHDAADAWLSLVVGGSIMTCATLRCAAPEDLPGLSWANATLGLLTLVSPWTLHFANAIARVWTDAMVGLIVVGLGSLSAVVTLIARQEERMPAQPFHP